MVDPTRQAWRAIADANFVAAHDLVRQHAPTGPRGRREFGRAIAIATGHPVAFFNPVLALDPATAADDVLAAVAWIRGLGLPASARVMDGTDPEIGMRLADDGLLLDPDPETVMVLEPIHDAPPAPDGVRVRAGGEELIEEWHVALEAGERLRAIVNAELVADPDVRISVLDVDGEPVACAMAFRLDESLGIYSVATVERARHRGYGRAVTWAAIDAGRRAWGSRIALLQSSVMGRSLYRSMGFETLGDLRLWRSA
jgi:ribosomal protein S18 acetylase RimI-like enzyme